MGQAFRRAACSAKIRSPTIHNPPPPPTPSKSKSKIVINHSESILPPVVGSTTDLDSVNSTAAGQQQYTAVNADNMLEERDPQYDVLLNQMVGRIKTKPGGKPEMGEQSSTPNRRPPEQITIGHRPEVAGCRFLMAFVVQKSTRPMPKLRNTTADTGRYETSPVPPGTLNVAQLKHVMLLHQGKADDHVGSMDAHQIADKYRIDIAVVQNILQFLSLATADPTKQKN
ncbi:hypothetical protein ACFE04_006614 [Oxalis oulophora]